MSMSTNIRSRRSSEVAVLAVRIFVGSWTPLVFAQWRPRGVPEATDHRSALVPAQDRLDHLALRRLDEGDDLHLAEPHSGQANGSISYSRLMSMAHVWCSGGTPKAPGPCRAMAGGPRESKQRPGGSQALACTGLTDPAAFGVSSI